MPICGVPCNTPLTIFVHCIYCRGTGVPCNIVMICLTQQSTATSQQTCTMYACTRSAFAPVSQHHPCKARHTTPTHYCAAHLLVLVPLCSCLLRVQHMPPGRHLHVSQEQLQEGRAALRLTKPLVLMKSALYEAYRADLMSTSDLLSTAFLELFWCS